MDFQKEMTGFYMHSVCLPEEVTQQFNNLAGKSLEFRSSSGKVWRIGLIKSGDKLVLQPGWSEFASSNNILQNDLLLFKLVSGSTFEVRIIDTLDQEKDDLEREVDDVKVQESIMSIHNSRKRSWSQDCVSLSSVKRLKIINRHTLYLEKSTMSTKRSRNEDCTSIPSKKKVKISDCCAAWRKDEKSAFKENHILLSQNKEKSLEREGTYEVSVVQKVSGQAAGQLEGSNNDLLMIEQRCQEFGLQENSMSETKIKIKNHSKSKLIDWYMSIGYARTKHQWTAMSAEQKARADHLALKIQAENPAFLHVIQETCVARKTCINIPKGFSIEHLQEGNQTFLLHLPEKENSWSVKCSVEHNSGGGRSRIRGASCLKFFKDNNLQKGDICLFVLAKTSHQITFIVHISRER